MRARGAAVHGALAGVGLIAAYVTWQRAPEVVASDVVVVEGTKNSLEKLRHQDRSRWIELTREEEGRVWLSQGGQAAAPTEGDGGSPDAGTVAEAAKPLRKLKANDRAEKLLERFMPLRASRALGILEPSKLEELGLAASQQRLEITAAGSTRSFRVGTSAGGLGAPYLQDEKDQKVYLLAGSLLSELDPGSQQLVDRRLHAFKPTEFDALLVKSGPLQKEFVQTGAEMAQTTQLAAKATPERPDEFARNWHDKVWTRLIAGEVLGRGELPPGGEPAVELRIEYLSRGTAKGWLEVGRGAGAERYARSEQTAGWVSLLGGADEVLQEAKKVLGGP